MGSIPLNYHTRYQWNGEGEAGEISIDGMPVLPVGSPHSADRFCPEHILVIAAESCLANYVLLISSMSKLVIKDYQSSAEGELIDGGKDGFTFKRIVIKPIMTVEAGNEAQAERILKKAHDLCMVARALNCPVEVDSTIEVS